MRPASSKFKIRNGGGALGCAETYPRAEKRTGYCASAWQRLSARLRKEIEPDMNRTNVIFASNIVCGWGSGVDDGEARRSFPLLWEIRVLRFSGAL